MSCRRDEKREYTFVLAGKHSKNVKQIAGNDAHNNELGSYNSIEAGISTRIQVKYCDFIGFHGKFTDPKTKLRYFSSEQFQVGRHLPETTRNKLLSIRKANIVLTWELEAACLLIALSWLILISKMNNKNKYLYSHQDCDLDELEENYEAANAV